MRLDYGSCNIVSPFFADAYAQVSQPTKIRIGLSARNFSFLPFYVAEQRKFFEQEGIRTEMIYMRSPVAIPALSAGEIQYTTHFASVVRTAVKRENHDRNNIRDVD